MRLAWRGRRRRCLGSGSCGRVLCRAAVCRRDRSTTARGDRERCGADREHSSRKSHSTSFPRVRPIEAPSAEPTLRIHLAAGLPRLSQLPSVLRREQGRMRQPDTRCRREARARSMDDLLSRDRAAVRACRALARSPAAPPPTRTAPTQHSARLQARHLVRAASAQCAPRPPRQTASGACQRRLRHGRTLRGA
jgi:hypothetical protein